MGTAAINIHKRKRKSQRKLEPYPSQKPMIRFLDRLVGFVSFALPLTILPQIYIVWFERNFQGISLMTWSFFLVFMIPLFMYSVVHKDKKLMMMYLFLIIANALVVMGVLVLR